MRYTYDDASLRAPGNASSGDERWIRCAGGLFYRRDAASIYYDPTPTWVLGKPDQFAIDYARGCPWWWICPGAIGGRTASLREAIRKANLALCLIPDGVVENPFTDWRQP